MTSPASPWRPLAVGVALAVCTIAAFGSYTYVEVRRLRDEQSAISERNRKDSLQLLRIQNNLASLAALMRDMAERVEPYPLAGWKPAFERLRGDLADAARLQLRAEVFNLLNHANFGIPVADLNSPNFGRILSAGPPRLMQFAAKFIF